MIQFLNKKQLAFILDIKAEEARAKMCVAWAKSIGQENQATISRDGKKKIEDPYPVAMPIGVLATHLNLPSLQEMVNDIHDNYLKRPGTKKWILCDFPEKKIKSMDVAGDKKKITVPAALRSLLPSKIVKEIQEEWHKRYPEYA